MKRISFRRCRGQSVVELALVLPVLVLLLLGVSDLFRVIYAYNMIVNMSREGANLASRPVPAGDAPPIDTQGIMDALGNAAPLDMGKNGMMYLTEIYVSAGSTVLATTPWGGHSGPPSEITESSFRSKIGGMTLRQNGSIYLFEIFYTVDGLFLPLFSKQLHTIAIFQ